jgi:hypothetical protein
MVQVRLDPENARSVRESGKLYKKASGRRKSNATIVNELLRLALSVPNPEWINAQPDGVVIFKKHD